MTTAAVSSNLSKSKGQAILEYVLLAVCLCVIALRATFTESPTTQSTTLPSNVRDIAYSLSVSAVLISALILWLVATFLQNRFRYRFTGIELGLALFCAAAVAGGFRAADKRLAITDVTMVLAAVAMAVLLVQILDSQAKIRLVLAVIAALGVVSAYQCAEQFFISNQMTIEQYEQAPETMLEPMGIEPGSLQQFLLEHRLYSGSVRGFFTTRNSAGSFALLACFAAITLFIEKLKDRKSDPSWLAHLLARGIATAVVIFGFALIHSKGAILGLLFAAAILIALLRFGKWLKHHRKTILFVCLASGFAGITVIVAYGLTHGGLPGGNPMLVRWQYWQASAKMVADHPLTGVGPGNFSQYYPHYKPADALESVGDPHNFLLSVLTEYGPLGLLGFLAMIFVPLWKRAVKPQAKYVAPRFTRRIATAIPAPKTTQREPSFRALAITYLVVISAALLLIRPMIMSVPPADTIETVIYVIVTLYVMPVFAFVVGFLFLTTPSQTIRDTDTIRPILFCAVIGVLIHNLIDFAIFEPGVFTTCWAMIACLIAADSLQDARPYVVLRSTPVRKIMMVAAGVAVIWAYLNYALVPVAAGTAKIQQANQAISGGWYERAHYLLDEAGQEDALSPAALSLNGRLYLHRFRLSGGKNKDLLLHAETCLQAAMGRNQQNFKNFEQLAEVYTGLAEISTRQERTDYLNRAFDIISAAVERYPGCGRLRFKLASIAEQLGKNEIAVEQYRETVRIEDKYRAQFMIMYPEREAIISRLGQEKYEFALKRTKELANKSGI